MRRLRTGIASSLESPEALFSVDSARRLCAEDPLLDRLRAHARALGSGDSCGLASSSIFEKACARRCPSLCAESIPGTFAPLHGAAAFGATSTVSRARASRGIQ